MSRVHIEKLLRVTTKFDVLYAYLQMTELQKVIVKIADYCCFAFIVET